ncbi:MAG: fibronectin type III domain-containing protein, partial [Sphingobacteriales bacterium]
MKRRLLQHFKPLLMLIGGLILANTARSQYTTAAAYPFAATQSTFTYLTGATSLSGIQGDDVAVSGIPIGFTFYFAGNNYTTVSAGSNGWLSFNSITSSNAGNSTTSLSTIAPCVMPLWDDIDGAGGTASYKTTGTAPNRVFTLEWKNWEWNWSAGSISISFQVKLYEDTRIEILYKEESGTVNSPSASIGIAKSATDYQSLTNTTTSPTSSSTTFTTSISTRPTTGQSYMWGQPPCLFAPVNGTSANVTSSKATINWVHSANGAPPQNYEIVIDQNAGNPTVSGTPVTGTTYTATGLTPGTNYYAHVRGRCSGISTSNWLHISFATTLCIAPKVSMANITHESALALWNSLPVGINYQYIYN